VTEGPPADRGAAGPLSVDTVLRLQRAAGNQAVVRLAERAQVRPEIASHAEAEDRTDRRGLLGGGRRLGD
jgi:hypothetical protein